MITVWIDEITFCLRDNFTGDIVETEVVQVVRKSFLKKYNKKNGWYINWEEELNENEVYAIVLSGTSNVQGLVSLRLDAESKEVFASWACTNPESNKQLVKTPRYSGIGGHLFSVIMNKSMQLGKDGFFYGFAANESLLAHYKEMLGAQHQGILHEYHFTVDANAVKAKEILEAYNYEWTDAKL